MPVEQSITEAELLDWWSNVTYRPEEVFDFIKLPEVDSNFLSRDGRLFVGAANLSSGLDYPSLNLSVVPVASTFGMCYTVVASRPVPKRTALIVQAALPAGEGRMAAYVHAPGDQIGLNHNYWPGYVDHVQLGRGAVDLALEGEVAKSRNGEDGKPCEEGETERELAECIFKWAQRTYMAAKCPKSSCFSSLRTLSFF